MKQYLQVYQSLLKTRIPVELHESMDKDWQCFSAGIAMFEQYDKSPDFVMGEQFEEWMEEKFKDTRFMKWLRKKFGVVAEEVRKFWNQIRKFVKDLKISLLDFLKLI